MNGLGLSIPAAMFALSITALAVLGWQDHGTVGAVALPLAAMAGGLIVAIPAALAGLQGAGR